MNRLQSCAAVLWLVLAPTIGIAQDKFFDSNGVKIRYVEQGNGEPIVLLHGVESSLESWVRRDVLQDLARDYRVIALDARGHGKSGKPHDPKKYGREMALDIVRLLDHLGISRAHIVGYSMGGGLAYQVLTLHPDRFLTATLVAGAPYLQWTPELARRAEQEASEREQECVSRTLIFSQYPAKPPSEEDIKARSAACFADRNQDRFALAAVTRSRPDQVITPAQAAAVTVPTLGIVGSLDPRKAGLERLKKLRPGLKVLVVEGAVHTGDRGILARPEFIAALREFIAANRAS